MENSKDYFTIHEAARILEISVQSVYSLIRKGRLKAKKIGNYTFVAKTEIEQLLNSGYQPKKEGK